jgi:predicted ABC-type ATPase
MFYEKSLKYLKNNKQKLFNLYFDDKFLHNPKIAIFTAGASGAGKTEYALSRIEKEPFLLHIDTDKIRGFFTPVGYNGTNADEFQRISSKAVDFLYKESINKGYSIIMDTNFANINIATININKALKNNYLVEVVYIYQEIEKCIDFVKKREHITKRKVPKDKVIYTFKNSMITTLSIKELFKENILLTFIDRKNSIIYDDISYEMFFKLVKKDLL